MDTHLTPCYKFFNFDAVFGKKNCKIIGWHTLPSGVGVLGKSWINHWQWDHALQKLFICDAKHWLSGKSAWKKIWSNILNLPQNVNQMSHFKVPPPNLVNFWDFSLDHLKVPSSPLRIETSQELWHCGDYASYRLTMCNHNHLYPGIHVSMLLLLSISYLMHLNRIF